MTDAAIDASGVELSFGEEEVLKGVDLTVPAGDLVAVMGPNGVGKSVLFSCLAGSRHPTDGSVTVFGSNPVDRSDTTSYLLQDALCVERLTGRENIAFYERLHPQFTGEWQSYVVELGLEDDLDKRVEDYSGGMVRKLELAIALSIDVPLYLLDEPTSSLDLSTVQTVHRLLREEQDDGKTVVVSSHRPMDADIADRVAFVSDGTVMTVGTTEDLFDTLPPIVETTLTNVDQLAEVALEGEVFPSSGMVRAFAPPEADPEALAASLGNQFEVVAPTYTDLFNRYTRGSPAEP
ncbi:ABC transporter ATP-binding protein [Natronorubrum sp. DTA28]|uniref:ABC transporter ATP-binding protein n=1 Tax=Natronorubrum sp. DTA28 TaxID=3447019 RepID=UPI003F8258A1